VFGGFFDGSSWHQTGRVALSSGVWAHLAVTYNGSSVILYINGVADSGSVATSAASTESGNGVYIGTSWAGTRTNAVIDEAAIYPSALSAARILAHYNAGIVESTPTPTATVTATPTASATASSGDAHVIIDGYAGDGANTMGMLFTAAGYAAAFLAGIFGLMAVGHLFGRR
jgi:hypothetical protein